MTSALQARGVASDFDFLMGSWRVHNRWVKKRLAGSDEWDEFEATSVARPLLDGLGNEDEFRTDYPGGFIGMSFRFFDPKKKQWSIYWADTRSLGSSTRRWSARSTATSASSRGRTCSTARPILVRYIWSRTTTGKPRWEQAFSDDGGETWETNWIMDFTRAEDGT